MYGCAGGREREAEHASVARSAVIPHPLLRSKRLKVQLVQGGFRIFVLIHCTKIRLGTACFSHLAQKSLSRTRLLLWAVLEMLSFRASCVAFTDSIYVAVFFDGSGEGRVRF